MRRVGPLYAILTGALLMTANVGRAVRAEPPTLDERLERLASELEAQREKLHVPGMAIAVVHGDEIVLAQGFGLADMESDIVVTPETIFAVGSTTKAFTAAIIGMLVDEGRMSWDDAVTAHLPDFAMRPRSSDPDAVVTIRDLLSHRTGFTRMSVLWAAGLATQEEVLRTATGAEPLAGLRERFLYNNVMYLAAGCAAAETAGAPWADLVRDRILSPLRMSASTLSIADVQGDDRLSLGYRYETDEGTWTQVPMRNLDTIAPAGAINSNALDMARWVRLQLGRGEFEGRRLVSEDSIEEAWSKQIDMAPGGPGYGLGWMIHDRDGRRVVEHGGNIDGFSAQVTLYPDDDFGYVMLMNVGATQLQPLSITLVANGLFGPWEDFDPGAEAAIDYAPYLGEYVADFGLWSDARFTVLEQDGHLAVDVPGQMVYELKDPDDAGRWVFAIDDTVVVSFEQDDDGNVLWLTLHQGGLDIEFPREGVEIPIEVPLDELHPLLGSYHHEELSADVEVIVRNNRLAMDVPGQMAFELHPPDAEGRWVARATGSLAVEFMRDEDGAVSGLVVHEGASTRELPRVGGAPEGAVVTLADVEAVRCGAERGAALERLGTVRMTGLLRMPQSGITGRATWTFAPGGRFRDDADLAPFGASHTASDGAAAWVHSDFSPWEELSGVYLEQVMLGHPAALGGDWSAHFPTIRVIGTEPHEEGARWRIRLERSEDVSMTVFVDCATGDVVGGESVLLMPEIGGLPYTFELGDYRDVEGARIPFRMVREDEAQGAVVFEFERIETGLTVDEATWTIPKPGP